MRLRHSLASALLISGVLFVASVSAQNNPNNQNQSPTAQASKAVVDARINLQKAESDVQKVREKAKAALLVKPEWAPITAEMTKAQNDVTAAKRNAMNVAHSKPEYQALIKQREDADKVRQQASATPAPGSDDNKVSDADLATANNNYIAASLQMKAIEKQVVTDDQTLNDANARLDAAKAKLAQLDAEVDESLKNDDAYQQLQMAVVTAQQALDQAQQQLVQMRQQIAQQHAQDARSRSTSSNSSSSSGRR